MRVLVTRPLPDAEETARHLLRLGHRPVVAPLLAIVPTQAGLPSGSFDVIAATSANAVESLGVRRPGRLAATPFLAVGERTPRAARDLGFSQVLAAGKDAAELLAALVARFEPGLRVLYLAGTARKPDLELGLRRAGYSITVVETYEARAADALPRESEEMLRRGDIDAVLHYSRRSAATFCRLVAAAGLAPVAAGLAHHCISAAAAEPLAALAAERISIAAVPDGAGLLATLATLPPPGGVMGSKRP